MQQLRPFPVTIAGHGSTWPAVRQKTQSALGDDARIESRNVPR